MRPNPRGDHSGDSRVREAYGDHIYRGLAEVKAKYDPDNTFHHNKNIRPQPLLAASGVLA